MSHPCHHTYHSTSIRHFSFSISGLRTVWTLRSDRINRIRSRNPESGTTPTSSESPWAHRDVSRGLVLVLGTYPDARTGALAPDAFRPESGVPSGLVSIIPELTSVLYVWFTSIHPSSHPSHVLRTSPFLILTAPHTPTQSLGVPAHSHHVPVTSGHFRDEEFRSESPEFSGLTSTHFLQVSRTLFRDVLALRCSAITPD